MAGEAVKSRSEIGDRFHKGVSKVGAYITNDYTKYRAIELKDANALGSGVRFIEKEAPSLAQPFINANASAAYDFVFKGGLTRTALSGFKDADAENHNTFKNAAKKLEKEVGENFVDDKEGPYALRNNGKELMTGFQVQTYASGTITQLGDAAQRTAIGDVDLLVGMVQKYIGKEEKITDTKGSDWKQRALQKFGALSPREQLEEIVKQASKIYEENEKFKAECKQEELGLTAMTFAGKLIDKLHADHNESAIKADMINSDETYFKYLGMSNFFEKPAPVAMPARQAAQGNKQAKQKTWDVSIHGFVTNDPLVGAVASGTLQKVIFEPFNKEKEAVTSLIGLIQDSQDELRIKKANAASRQITAHIAAVINSGKISEEEENALRAYKKEIDDAMEAKAGSIGRGTRTMTVSDAYIANVQKGYDKLLSAKEEEIWAVATEMHKYDVETLSGMFGIPEHELVGDMDEYRNNRKLIHSMLRSSHKGEKGKAPLTDVKEIV